MIDRRRAISTAASIGVGLICLGAMPACAAEGEAENEVTPDPRLADYEMPLESEPHERTIMQWPVSPDVYDRASLARAQQAIARVANSIGEFEPVAMLVSGAAAGPARRMLGAAVELWDIPTDDLWCRDSGPTFVRNDRGALAVAHLRFNGWGNKQPHANDARIASAVAQRLGLPLLETGLVGEQGGVEHDGAGTLLAHASCWDNPNRNTESREVIGARLLAALGGRKMIWAPGIKGADITDYHIDALARFVAPGRLLFQLPPELDSDDPWSISAFETHEIVRSATGADGRPLDIVVINEPVDIRSRRRDFVASYVNYYVCNGAVISAEFGDRAADERARIALRSLYPEREIISLNVDAIGENGGGNHCATQQQPRAG